MSDTYTPTTEEMRVFYTAERIDGPHLAGFPEPTAAQAEAEFDRWLAAHAAQVRAEEPSDTQIRAAALAMYQLTSTLSMAGARVLACAAFKAAALAAASPVHDEGEKR